MNLLLDLEYALYRAKLRIGVAFLRWAGWSVSQCCKCDATCMVATDPEGEPDLCPFNAENTTCYNERFAI